MKSDADRVRKIRQVEKLSEKAQDYENLLKDLGNLVESRTADRIKSLLDKVCRRFGDAKSLA